MAKVGRKANREKALELAAKYGATKKAVKVEQGMSLESADINKGKHSKRFQQNLRS